MPIEVTTRARTTGPRSASAKLDGNKLTVSGSFAGLHGPATVARVYLGAMPAMRDMAIYEDKVFTSTNDARLVALDARRWFEMPGSDGNIGKLAAYDVRRLEELWSIEQRASISARKRTRAVR